MATEHEQPERVFGDVEECRADRAGRCHPAPTAASLLNPRPSRELAHRDAGECEERSVGGHEAEVDPEREPRQIFAMAAHSAWISSTAPRLPANSEPEDRRTARGLEATIEPGQNQVEEDRRPTEDDQRFRAQRQGRGPSFKSAKALLRADVARHQIQGTRAVGRSVFRHLSEDW